MRKMERTQRIVITICVLLGLVLLTALDAMFGGLRFVSSRANEVVDFAVSCLPLVCVTLLTRLPRSRGRIFGFVVLVPLAAFCVLGGVGDAVGEAAFPATVIRQSSVRVGYSHVVTYFSSVGILDDGEVFVQQEIKLLPGLLWVLPILNQGGTNKVDVRVVNRHHIRYDCTVYPEFFGGVSAPEVKRGVAWVF